MGLQVPFLMETRPGPSLWNAFGASVSEHTSKASSLLHCANVLPSCMFTHTHGGGGGEGRGIVVSSSPCLLTPDTPTHSEAPHHALSSRVYHSLTTTPPSSTLVYWSPASTFKCPTRPHHSPPLTILDSATALGFVGLLMRGMVELWYPSVSS